MRLDLHLEPIQQFLLDPLTLHFTPLDSIKPIVPRIGDLVEGKICGKRLMEQAIR